MSTLDYNVLLHIRKDEMEQTRFPSIVFYELMSKANIYFSVF